MLVLCMKLPLLGSSLSVASSASGPLFEIEICMSFLLWLHFQQPENGAQFYISGAS